MPIEILMPALSPTMTEGNLAKWTKKEGDKVGPGDVIAEIETDKATMEVEAVDEGVLGKILVKAGTSDVAVNEPIALLLEDGEDKKELDSYKPKKKEEPKAEEAEASSGEKSDKSAPKKQAVTGGEGFTAPPALPEYDKSGTPQITPRSEVSASPLAKRVAKEKGINIEGVIGTGPKGRIVKADVEDAANAGGSGRIIRNSQEISAVPVDNMRKVIANRLLQAKQHVPHFYLNVDCDLDKLLELRKDLNDEAQIDSETGKPAYKISVNDLIIKAVAKALKKIPEANASWGGDDILYYNNVDVSVAVAIDGGLITPIVKNADQKSLPLISNEMKDLAKRARANKLQPEEFQGGGFSISNLGMYGIKNFNAIINPPQSCILAVGSGEQRPVVKNGQIVPATVMTATLSCDHRVVDGAVGAEFITAFKGFIEKPIMMII